MSARSAASADVTVDAKMGEGSAGATVVVHDPLCSENELASYNLAPDHLGDRIDAALIQADRSEYGGSPAGDVDGATVVLDVRRVIEPESVLSVIGIGFVRSRFA